VLHATLRLSMSEPVLRVVSSDAVPLPLTGAALGEALAREAPILLAAARAIVLDDAEAEDLVATTLEIAVRHASTLREPAALRRWLLTIQTREAFRVRRRLSRLVRFDAGVSEIPAAGLADADQLAIRDALRRLPARMRAAVVLHHLVGLSVAETAGALGTSENTVKSQLRVGLQRLRASLGDD
jgi:RNA polymerase sigma factor (sigma-70 family)